MKQCSKCKAEQPLTDFTKRKNTKDGFHQQCKKCLNAKIREWKNKNIDKVRAANKEYKKRNPDIVAASKKRAYERDPLKHIEWARKYRQLNPDAGRTWKQNNVLKVRESTEKRRKTIIENGAFEIRLKFLQKLYSSPCVFCGSKERIEMDHVIPVSRGGKHSEGNLQPLCRSCNASKRNKLVIEYKMYLKNTLRK